MEKGSSRRACRKWPNRIEAKIAFACGKPKHLTTQLQPSWQYRPTRATGPTGQTAPARKLRAAMLRLLPCDHKQVHPEVWRPGRAHLPSKRLLLIKAAQRTTITCIPLCQCNRCATLLALIQVQVALLQLRTRQRRPWRRSGCCSSRRGWSGARQSCWSPWGQTPVPGAAVDVC